MDSPSPDEIEPALTVRILRLEAVVQGVAWGLVAGLALFLATNFLVLKGGRVVGPHLSLLRQFFIGYEVSFVGSLIGFAYAFAVASSQVTSSASSTTAWRAGVRMAEGRRASRQVRRAEARKKAPEQKSFRVDRLVPLLLVLAGLFAYGNALARAVCPGRLQRDSKQPDHPDALATLGRSVASSALGGGRPSARRTFRLPSIMPSGASRWSRTTRST